MPLYGTFDNWENIGEGGVAFQSFLNEWSSIIAALDRNDVCGAEEVKGWNCWKTRLLTPGVRPVDEDEDGRQLAQMVGQHRNIDVAEAIRKVEFRDDPVATDEGTIRLADISPSGLREKIEPSQVPMMVWCGWFDGNPEGPLIRYRTFSNPQVLVIGPLSHGGDFNVDPFAPKHTPPVPAPAQLPAYAADYAGWYEPDSPRTELTHFLARLHGLSRVKFQDGQLILSSAVGGLKEYFLPVTARQFRRVPEKDPPPPAPTLELLSVNTEGRFIQAEPGTMKMIPAWFAIGEILCVLFVILSIVAILVYAPFWICGGFMKSRRRPAERAMRFWPLLAVLSLMAFVVIFITASSDLID